MKFKFKREYKRFITLQTETDNIWNIFKLIYDSMLIGDLKGVKYEITITEE
jgi:hypothetical protein